MLSHFDSLLITTATDGASAAIKISSNPDAEGTELHQLLDAWYRERQQRIEDGLFLERAQEILNRIIQEGEVTSVRRRQAARLLRAIKATKKGRREES